jgi:hypothetical protein
MFGYCHLKNYISLQYFDRPIFEGFIALFDLEYFIKIEKYCTVNKLDGSEIKIKIN